MEAFLVSASNTIELQVEQETLEFKTPLRISGRTFTSFPAIVVTLRDGDFSGRGEATGVYYRDGGPDDMVRQIEGVRPAIERGADRATLQTLLPKGGARNALDCALWDIDAKRSRKSVAEMAGVAPLRTLRTTFTLSADEPQAVAAAATAWTQAQALKLKLAGDNEDAARVKAARDARPDAWLGVDANQGFTRKSLEELMPTLLAANVQMVEQPFAIGREGDLDGFDSSIPVAADESAQGIDDLPGLVGRFDIVNIKLDKCGGLTEALAMARRIRELGMQPMVGCMGGSSLAMAPAFVVGQLCDYVDLDAPLWLASDRQPAAQYGDGNIFCPEMLWGGA
jgi:L-alanine-DL-glutamate epimerase-like enolase superfamily enzyme